MTSPVVPAPALSDLLDRVHVVGLPMRVRFRGVTERQVVLIEGPAGWGEFGPFPEYGDAEAVWWLRSAVETAWAGLPEPVRDRVEVNATVPAVPADEVAGVLAGFPGCGTAKVKVAEPGQGLGEDVARVEAVVRARPGVRVRVDANGGWGVAEAVRAVRELDAVVRAGGCAAGAGADAGPGAAGDAVGGGAGAGAAGAGGDNGTRGVAGAGGLEYVEQPCATVEELVEVRKALAAARVRVDVAADESIRRAEDPLRVVRAGGADRAVVKVAPLGGPRRLVAVAGELGVPVTVSSALDSAVGIGVGVGTAAALPRPEGVPVPASGLGTGGFFVEDVVDPEFAPQLVDGSIRVGAVRPDPERLAGLAVGGGDRRWWIERLRRCLEVY